MLQQSRRRPVFSFRSDARKVTFAITTTIKKTMKSAFTRRATRRSLAIACVFLLGACAAQPPIDVSNSQNLVRSNLLDVAKPTLSAVDIINQAKVPDARISAFDDVHISFKTQTAQTVTSDIASYFKTATQNSANTTQKVSVTIDKADAYWVFGGAKRIPFIGLFAAASDCEYVMDVRATFEVEVNGKVTKTFTMDREYSFPDGKATGLDDIKAAYQRLVALYREKFFAELDERFVTRYLQ